jgi:hypothetical protein
MELASCHPSDACNLRWSLDFSKICTPVVYMIHNDATVAFIITIIIAVIGILVLATSHYVSR